MQYTYANSYICSDKVIILQLILSQTNERMTIRHIDQVKDANVNKKSGRALFQQNNITIIRQR